MYGPNEHLHLWKTDSWSQNGSCLPVYHGAGRSLLKEGGEWYHSLSSDWQCWIHTTIMKGQDILIVSWTLNQWKEINHPFYQKKVHMLGGGKGGGGGPRESPKTLMTPKFKKGKVDNTIPWINLHQLDSTIDFPKTYLLDSYHPVTIQSQTTRTWTWDKWSLTRRYKIIEILILSTQKVGMIIYQGHKTGNFFVLDSCLLTRDGCTWRFNCINLFVSINIIIHSFCGLDIVKDVLVEPG